MKIKNLIIAPHPDDEILGCGGLLVKQGNQSHVLYIAMGDIIQWTNNGKKENYVHKRMDEITAVKQKLGFSYDLAGNKIGYTNHCKLDIMPIKTLIDYFEKEIEGIKPENIFFPYYQSHDQDHRAVSEAVLTACRPKPSCYTGYNLFYYDEPKLIYNHAGCHLDINYYIELTKKELDEKIKALKLHESQIRQFPNMRSPENIIAQAQLTGAKFGVKYAEGYGVLKCRQE